MSALADRQEYQRAERALLAEHGVDLSDEPTCRGCGCSDSLACEEGCWWVEADLCSACADQVDDEEPARG